MNLVSFVFLILLMQFLFFGIALGVISLIRKQRGITFLSLSFILRSILYLAPALTVFLVNIEYSVWITGPITVTLIPLNFLFVKKIFTADKTLKWRDLWHFVPLLLDSLFTFYFALNHASEIVNNSVLDLTEILDSVWEGNFYYTLLSLVGRTVTFIQCIVYSILTIPIVKTCTQNQKDHQSVLNLQYLSWLKVAVFVFILMGLISGLTVFGIYATPAGFILMSISLAFYGFFFFVFAILFSEQKWSEITAIALIDTQVTQKGKIWMEDFLQKRMFLQADLCLEKASLQMNIPKYRITQQIKHEGYQNFYSFVNHFRVEESKRLLNELPSSYVVDSIVGKSGFSSRSTFYRVFKEFTGQTPKAYLKQN